MLRYRRIWQYLQNPMMHYTRFSGIGSVTIWYSLAMIRPYFVIYYRILVCRIHQNISQDEQRWDISKQCMLSYCIVSGNCLVRRVPPSARIVGAAPFKTPGRNFLQLTALHEYIYIYIYICIYIYQFQLKSYICAYIRYLLWKRHTFWHTYLLYLNWRI